jgi:Mg2+/Co2+ transporter CorB
MIVIWVVFILSIVGSFLFAGFETGIISLNLYKVDHAQEMGKKMATVLLSLVEKQSIVISTVLIGNNVALVGMQWAFTLIWAAIFGENSNEIISTSFLTIFVLLLCELFPKSLFRIYSYQLTLFFSPIISFFAKIFYPLTWIIDLLTSKISVNNEIQSLPETELQAIAREGERINELDNMIPQLGELIFTIEKIAISEFVDNLTVIEAENYSVTVNENDNMNKLFSYKELFSNKNFRVNCSDGSYKVYSFFELFFTLLSYRT